MRALLVALSLIASACAVGSGIDPDAETTTAPDVTPSTITVDEGTRLAAVEVAGRFYDAVLAGDGVAVASLGIDPPAAIQEELDQWAQSIGLEGGSFIVTRSSFTDTSAEVTVRLTLDLTEVGPWSYETAVTLVGGDPWTVIWSPSTLHPSLEPGDILRVDRSWMPRASILAADGTPLAGAEAVKVIGVVPGRIEDLPQLQATLAALAGIDPAVVAAEISRPGVRPDWFVPVGSIKLVVYDAVSDQLESLPGVVIRDGSERLPFRADFAEHLVGSVGPITADQLEELGFPYGPTDVVGQSGLEAVYESQLAGRPRTAIVRVNKFGRVAEDLFVLEAAMPQDLRTTIDVDVQSAIERALPPDRRRIAVVVIESATGQVRGIASRPLTDGFDRALLGTYPPGSTFKVVTATALLENGFTTSTAVECPAEVTLGGRSFRNAGDLELGTITFLDAFAASCNTTFAAAAVAELDATDLEAVAETFGFGTEPNLGIPSAASVFPTPVDAADLAASAIGQGRVLASPIHMASVAAAVASGAWRSPTVISTATRPPGNELERAAVSSLADMMLAVVTSGTGRNAAVSGIAVHGKTGSAEFGDKPDPDTHAWFIGYWGKYAIAVLVEDGGGGGSVAAPIAQRIISEIG